MFNKKLITEDISVCQGSRNQQLDPDADEEM